MDIEIHQLIPFRTRYIYPSTESNATTRRLIQNYNCNQCRAGCNSVNRLFL